MKEAFGLLVFGIVVGLPNAYLLGRLVSSQLFGVAPADARTVAAASITLAPATATAACVPACRAATIYDPVWALGQE